MRGARVRIQVSAGLKRGRQLLLDDPPRRGASPVARKRRCAQRPKGGPAAYMTGTDHDDPGRTGQGPVRWRAWHEESSSGRGRDSDPEEDRGQGRQQEQEEEHVGSALLGLLVCYFCSTAKRRTTCLLAAAGGLRLGVLCMGVKWCAWVRAAERSGE